MQKNHAIQKHILGKASGRVDGSLKPRASRSTDRLNITRAPTPKANLNARVTALIKMLWRHAAMLTSCIVFLTLWPSGRRTDSSLGDVYA